MTAFQATLVLFWKTAHCPSDCRRMWLIVAS